MGGRGAWACFALSWVGCLRLTAADLVYHFTMGVTSPAPLPGQPFKFTWTGGEPDEAVYIVLNGYFPNTPDQNIIYITTDILSGAPNNGSWTYNVPLNIQAGRHSFSIGYNPLQLSDQTEIFIIDASQTSYTYNGCGLPPLPDYTYTAYQPPCTVTTDGRITTLFPIVPASLSSLYSRPTAAATTTPAGSPPPSSSASSSPSSTRRSLFPTTLNSAFASGVFAQDLQCSTAVTPSTTHLTSSGTTTVFSVVDCAATSQASISGDGTCHESGYSTFSVSGTSSVCCPNGWATTPLNEDLWCFTSMEGGNREELEKRQASITTLSGLAFTSAGVVTRDAGQSGAGTSGTPTPAGSAASATPSKGAGTRFNFGSIQEIVATMSLVYYFL